VVEGRGKELVREVRGEGQVLLLGFQFKGRRRRQRRDSGGGKDQTSAGKYVCRKFAVEKCQGEDSCETEVGRGQLVGGEGGAGKTLKRVITPRALKSPETA